MDVYINGAIVSNDDKWIYDEFGMEATAPADICRAVNAANGKPLDVYINSGGGSLFAGSEIYSLLRNYPGTVNIHIVGIAASAASVIACAAHSDISPTAMVMIHNVSSVANGDYHAMDKESEILKRCNEAVCNAYVYKTGKDKSELLSLMDKETWLTAEQAVEFGLVDSIAEPKSNIAPLTLVASCEAVIPQAIINKTRRDFAKKRALAKLNLLKHMEVKT